MQENLYYSNVFIIFDAIKSILFDIVSNSNFSLRIITHDIPLSSFFIGYSRMIFYGKRFLPISLTRSEIFHYGNVAGYDNKTRKRTLRKQSTINKHYRDRFNKVI